MFDSLSDRLEGAFKKLKGQGSISEVNIASSLKEVRRALVDADVNYKIAKEFTNEVKERAIGEEVIKAVSPGEMIVKIVQDELTKLMGGEAADFDLEVDPAVILLAGLQGSGKTTFAAKMANHLKRKKSKKPLLIACDVYRPAAIDQLKVMADQIEIDVYTEDETKDPEAIATNGIDYAKQNGYNAVVIDTAGRLSIDDDMMNEISGLKKVTNPNETLFVVDSMTGQDAVSTAKTFNEQLDYDGVVLTKLDGDTRGGAALSIRYVVDKPIKFISTGEKMDTIEVFHPERMAQRILGMGDVVSFVERAQEQYDEEQAAKLQKKINKNTFDFNDFLSQLNQIKKMGNIKDLLGMIPGMSKQVKNLDIDNDSFKNIEAIIQSMTPAERENPQLLDGSRRKRIAKGSGNSVQEVNQFIKQFNEMKKMMKSMSKMQSSGNAMKGMPFMNQS